MKVSQLIHAMHREDEIIINDFDEKIDKWLLYNGAVKGIKRDNPINKMHIMKICADDDVICVLVTKQRSKQ